MKRLLLLLCISLSGFANAQQKILYTGTVEGGLLIGSSQLGSFVFITQGLACKQYTLSAGSGFDFYRLPSTPLFIDIKSTFFKTKTQLYLDAAAGINFTSSHSSAAKNINYYNSNGKFSDGVFIKCGGGFIFRAQKKIKISLSAGYTYKTAAFIYKPLTEQPGNWQVEPIKDIYHCNRWYTGVGIIW